MYNGLKMLPEDFQVNEILGFKPAGEGQHIMLHIQKYNLNTIEVVQHLGAILKVPYKNIGYSGLKDKHAITTQFFTVDLAGKKISDFSILNTQQITILSAIYHRKKLKIGTHKSNQFNIILRNLFDKRNLINYNLTNIKQQGIPNHFGHQRFGNNNSNYETALKLFAGDVVIKSKRKKGFLLSTMRAFLFNKICDIRVKHHNWNHIVSGDIVQLEGSNSIFKAEQCIDYQKRLDKLDLHPTAPLFGVGGLQAEDEAKQIETLVFAKYPEITRGLVNFKTNGLRRALRAKVYNLKWQWINNNLTLTFILNRGSFATTVVDHLLLDKNINNI